MSSVGGLGLPDGPDEANRLQLAHEVRTALTENQLVLHYQPKVDLRTRHVHGVEALVRWDHPKRGLLYPDAFIDLVEEAGLMGAMTRMVLGVALDQVMSWQAQSHQLTVSVNLSASSLVDTGLSDEVAAMLASRDLPPGTLQLEISEQSLLVDQDHDRARDIFTRLRRNGVQISIDDAGIGYRTGPDLPDLPDLPIDELKLDSSFISPVADDVHAAALVASTIGLAHSRDLRLVAEGVETNLAYAILTRLGCDQAQGYLVSRPVSAARLDDWLSARRAGYKLRLIP